MFFKIFCNFFIFIFIINFLGLEKSVSRELSIKELEIRKKADEQRYLERQKRGIKKSTVKQKFQTEIIFFTKERKIPPVLSNLDPILNDEGFYGVKLGNEDNLTTGNFLGHNYKFKFIQVSLEEELKKEFISLVNSGYKYFIIDLNTEEILELTQLEEFNKVLVFNTRSQSDELRNKSCHKNLFHVVPSNSILADALTQYLVKKKWKKWFLVVGPEDEDKNFAEALKRSAEKFNIKIKEERIWDFTSDLRRTSQKEVPIFTKGVKYDVLVVSDVKGEFGEYLMYRTWDPRPVVGTQGLRPISWHRTHEQWGAVQMQNRFRRNAGRWMTPVDYGAWVGMRSLGEAITRIGKNNFKDIRDFLISKKFGIGAYKGVKVSYRSWNRQLRQPILLSAPRSMVSVSPQEGYLHPVSELDTLGYDESESTCNIK